MFSACFEPLIDHPPWFPMIPKLLIDKPKTAHSNLKDLRFVLKKSCCLPPREKGDPNAPSLKAGAGWAWSWAWPRGPSARASSGSSSSPSTWHIINIIKSSSPAGECLYRVTCFMFPLVITVKSWEQDQNIYRRAGQTPAMVSHHISRLVMLTQAATTQPQGQYNSTNMAQKKEKDQRHKEMNGIEHKWL